MSDFDAINEAFQEAKAQNPLLREVLKGRAMTDDEKLIEAMCEADAAYFNLKFRDHSSESQAHYRKRAAHVLARIRAPIQAEGIALAAGKVRKYHEIDKERIADNLDDFARRHAEGG